MKQYTSMSHPFTKLKTIRDFFVKTLRGRKVGSPDVSITTNSSANYAHIFCSAANFNGSYYCKIAIPGSAGCVQRSDTLNFSSIISLRQEDTSSFLPAKNWLANLYPNPADGALILELKNISANTELQLSLYDLFGKQCASEFLSAQAGNNRYLINLPSILSDGLYLLRISDEKEQQIMKLIIQKN